MRIATKIAIYQSVVAAMLIASAAVTYYAVDRIDYYFDRTRITREQMDVAIRLEAQVNRFSENIAELLLLGRDEQGDLDDARAAVDRHLVDLTRLIDRELAFVESEEERAEEEVKHDRVRRMRALFETIDRTTHRLLFLRETGRVDEAVELFRTEVEDRFDAELEVLVAETVADEEDELARAEQHTNALEDRLKYLVFGVLVFALVVAGGAGVVMTRALTRPLRALIDGARAVGEGDLGYRIASRPGDEFADAAQQFDLTAARLEAQRAELLAIQAGLEAEVARRTGELEEANSRLTKLDEMRMLFLAEIGHELRTPLTVIRGEAEIALRGERAVAEHRETLARVVQLAHQMGRLVDDLMFLARAEVGAVRFDMQLLSLQEIAEIAGASARVLAVSRRIELSMTMPAEPCLVEGDAERLSQALLIALDNAAKYADVGSRMVLTIEPEGAEACVRVENTGEPIPAADMPYVFNRFYRGRQDGTGGVGLGLPIAKWIVDRHGGTIAITSAGRSTLLSIRLPQVRA